MKQAQIQQAFIYILAVIVIGFIVLMGFKYINFFTDKKCDVEFVDFKVKLDKHITKHSALGEYLKEDLKAPCQSKSVCFVDARAIKSRAVQDPSNQHPIISQSASRGVEQNIFLISDKTEPIGYNPAIALENPDKIFCLNRVNGNFYLAFRGMGLVDGTLRTRLENGR